MALETLEPITDEKQKCLDILEGLYHTRFLDDKMSKFVRQNKGGTFHVSVAGHEMVGVVCAKALIPGKDWGLPYYRDRAFAVGIGCSLVDLLAGSLARVSEHHSGGRMMPEHFSHKELRIPCQSSCVGSQFLQAVGVAKALQLSDVDEVVYVSSGEGATSQGDFHEALNFACLHKLGVIFVVQDNGWAISVPVNEQTAGSAVGAHARGYVGLSVHMVDGCHYEELSQAMAQAVAKGRAKEGPTLIVAKVERLGPHSSSDDPTKYKSAQQISNEKNQDPVGVFERWLLHKEMVTTEELAERRDRCFKEVEEAALEAERRPFPESETAATAVFKPFEPRGCTAEKNLRKTTEATHHGEEGIKKTSCAASANRESVVMVDALNHALDEAMRQDEHVVVFGQDVAHGKGGVFGVTRYLTEKHGKERCFNSPLAESTIIGVALGMSFVAPYKPVVEIQFADYMWTGVNQLLNELASIHYRSNGEWNCPVVVRMPCGGYIQGGPYHSQSIEAYLAHCPGLKIAIPSNAADAKRLLKTAIQDPNPVVFLEHKALYRQRVFCARPEPAEEESLPFGVAKVVRAGSAVTVVAYGILVVMAMEVADKLSKEGIEIEVIDLRTIVPLDMETVLTSLRKTGKLLIAHEAVRNAGFGAEIAARAGEEGFKFLDAPIVRVAAQDCPVPYSKVLEDAVLPQPEKLEAAVRALVKF